MAFPKHLEVRQVVLPRILWKLIDNMRAPKETPSLFLERIFKEWLKHNED